MGVILKGPKRIRMRRSRIFTEGLERVNAFSDGIFAIAITLLVLEIHIPELNKDTIDQLPEKLWELVPNILYFCLSFLVIGIYWMMHRGLFSYIRRYDSRLLWLNNLFLLTIAFQPIPTAIIGNYGSTTTAVLFYSASQILSALFKLFIWLYASYKRRLIDADLSVRFINYYTFESISTVLIFVLSFGLAFINNDLAKYSWLLLAVDGLIIRRIYQPEPREEPAAEGVVAAGPGEAPVKVETPPKPGPVEAAAKVNEQAAGNK